MDTLTGPAGSAVVADLLDSVRVRSTVYCRSVMAAPWGFGVEAHGNPSFHVVTRGECWLEVDDHDEPLHLRGGELVVLPKGPGHWVRDQPQSAIRWLDDILATTPPDRDGRLRYGGDGARTELICGGFVIEADRVDPILRALPAVLRVPGTGDGPAAWVSATLELVADVARSDGAGATAVLNRLADTMLAQALRVALQATDGSRLASLTDPQIAKAVGLIHREPERRWTVEELAAAVAYSRSAFAGRFRELVGESPMSYLTRTRLAVAAALLRRPNVTVGEAARRAGYASESSFSRAFKRAFGVAPGSYRSSAPFEHRRERPRVEEHA